jgi:hypothetical protein
MEILRLKVMIYNDDIFMLIRDSSLFALLLLIQLQLAIYEASFKYIVSLKPRRRQQYVFLN